MKSVKRIWKRSDKVRWIITTDMVVGGDVAVAAVTAVDVEEAMMAVEARPARMVVVMLANKLLLLLKGSLSVLHKHTPDPTIMPMDMVSQWAAKWNLRYG